MRIPRLLFRRLLVWLSVLIAWLLILLWAAPAAAQTDRSPQTPPAATAQAPATRTPGTTHAQIHLPDHFRGSAANLSRPDLHSIAPRNLRPVRLQPRSPSVLIVRSPETGSNLRSISPERCYTVREYRYQRDDPTSDATSFRDYQACEPANQFHLRAAVSAPPPVSVPNARPNSSLPHCGFAYGNVCPAMVPAGPPITR